MDNKATTDNNATLVVTAIPNPSEMASVQEYLHGVLPLFLSAGGKLVKRLKVDQALLGDPTGMTLVMDFESADKISALFDSDAYQALVPLRDKGFAEMNIWTAHSM